MSVSSLGIPDFKLMGLALRLRWLWSDRCNQLPSRGLADSKEDKQARAFFEASINCLVGDGSATLFWADPWMDDQRIGALAPDQLAAVNVGQRRRWLVAEALQGNAWIHDITRVLSVPAIVQYLQLCERLDGTVLQQGVQDKVIWKWTSFEVYSTRSAYAALTLRQSAFYGDKEAWKVHAPREHKFFI
jgi:hypothetical protein